MWWRGTPWVIAHAYMRLMQKRAIEDANRRRRAAWEGEQWT